MLTTNAQLDILSSAPSFLDGNFHELPHTRLINNSKWIVSDNFLLLIMRQEGAGIITAHTKSRLRQVIGSETEELCCLSNLIRSDGATRHFNHGPHQITQFHTLFLRNFFGHSVDDLSLQLKFLTETDQRNHDFGVHLDFLLLNVRCRFENGAYLHLSDFRIGDRKATTPVTEHWVELVQLMHSFLNLRGLDLQFLR